MMKPPIYYASRSLDDSGSPDIPSTMHLVGLFLRMEGEVAESELHQVEDRRLFARNTKPHST